MVRLFRGARGRGVPRAPMMMPRHLIRPHEYEPDFIPPFHEPDFIAPYDVPRGRLLRGRPGRVGPPGPHPPPRRMVPPPLPQRHLPLPPHQPLDPREMPVPLPRRPLPRDMQIHLGLGPSRRPPRDMPIPVSRRPPPRMLPIPASRGSLPLHLRGRRPGMPLPINPMPPGPPLRRPLRRGMPLLRRGRGGTLRRGAAVKRLGSSTNGRAKKKEKTEEMELNKPWVTEALKTEIHKKYQLYETAKEKKTEDDWKIYREQRILVGKMNYTAKLEYIGTHPEADVNHIMFGAGPKG